ncbi:MAG TPA: OPT/YSL family transporter, partial [Kofleriaceae bacterium]|nr:OPT/YSL family transporter [Kofleriaceae bacterium]
SRVRLLIAAIAAGAILPVLRDLRGMAVIGDKSKLFDWLPRITAGGVRHPVSDAGLMLDHSLLLVGAGVFVGLRTTVWMLAGGLVTGFVLGPIGLASMWTDPLGHIVAATGELGRASDDLGIWLGAPLLIAYALVALAGQWRAFVRTFAAPRVRRAAAALDAASAAVEIPASWFWCGFALCGGTAIALGRALFDIPVPLGCLAVATSLVFGMVASRICGETDINPGGPMGKVTQLGFGILRPHYPATNLMTAAMTHASSVAAADLLNDLKSGYLLGADPRRQFFAQLAGIAAGTAASVLAYFLLIPDAFALTGHGHGDVPQFAAPGAHFFHKVAVLLQYGLDHLHPMQRTLVVAGAIGGLVIAAAERLASPRVARWLPSAAGLGLGLYMPLRYSLGMVIGAAIAAVAAARRSDAAERYVWPISAGLLGGESLAGVVVAMINNFMH